MKFGVDAWESLVSLPKQPSEQLIPYYSNQFGLEVTVRSIDPAAEERRIKEKMLSIINSCSHPHMGVGTRIKGSKERI